MSYTWALEKALALGCNVFITHEPTFFNHLDEDLNLSHPQYQAKKRLIGENQLVIIRCHDLWDQYPVYGILDCWARFLGLKDRIHKEEYMGVYKTVPQTALELARSLVKRTSRLGQPVVQLIGPKDARISRLAIGTGAITPFIPVFHIPQRCMAKFMSAISA